jgi:hypothetical protein
MLWNWLVVLTCFPPPKGVITDIGRRWGEGGSDMLLTFGVWHLRKINFGQISG